uniref:Melanocortin 2 receptor accessory protein n=1 Tax=Paramormyrops kingsleyae TaxID=1676925 RepID=A0A3B3QK04_9TELE
MTNSTDSSDYDWKYEYYYDYLDPIIVDEKNLKFNKYSIVIIFWTGMAAFVVFLFLVLMYLSRSGSQATVCKWTNPLASSAFFP